MQKRCAQHCNSRWRAGRWPACRDAARAPGSGVRAAQLCPTRENSAPSPLKNTLYSSPTYGLSESLSGRGEGLCSGAQARTSPFFGQRMKLLHRTWSHSIGLIDLSNFQAASCPLCVAAPMINRHYIREFLKVTRDQFKV